MSPEQVNRIGELLANGTAPSTICKALGIAPSVLSESPEIAQAIASATLHREETRVVTGRKLQNLKESVVDQLEAVMGEASLGELTGLLTAIGKLPSTTFEDSKGDRKNGRTVQLVVNNVVAPRLQVSDSNEILAIDGQSLIPATGDELHAIIKRAEGSREEAME